MLLTNTALRALLAKASPLPWKTELLNDGLNTAYCIRDDNGGLVARFHYVNADDNAPAIVAAVNSLGPHLDRIEALEAALRECTTGTHADLCMAKSAMDRARALLEGE